MRALGTFLAMGILALTVGCGDSSSNGKDGGTGGTGGMLGGGTGGMLGGGTGGAGASGSCNLPSCLTTTTITGCAPSGTCVEQADATGLFPNRCYANGVKEITTVDLTTLAFTITYKNSKGVCYSIQASENATTGSATFTLKNASGAAIGTGTSDGTTTTFTCAGGQPVTLDATCDTSSFAGSASSGTSDTCTTGTCTP